MKPRILQNGRLLRSLEDALANEFDLHPLWREKEPDAFLRREGSDW